MAERLRPLGHHSAAGDTRSAVVLSIRMGRKNDIFPRNLYGRTLRGIHGRMPVHGMDAGRAWCGLPDLLRDVAGQGDLACPQPVHVISGRFVIEAGAFALERLSP